MPGTFRAPHQAPGKAPVALYTLIALLAFAVYLPALSNGFLNWDDNLVIHQNPGLRYMGGELLRFAFTSEVNNNWHPLTVISYALDFQLWGLDPKGYHLTNIILHSINTFLAGVLAMRLVLLAYPESGNGGARAPMLAGAVAALLFGLHPMHVESVVWISERKDVLYALFYLLSILAYLRYAAKGRGFWYAACLVFFALSILSKPMAITLPVVLLVLDLYPLERLSFRNAAEGRAGGMLRVLLEKVPFFAVCVISAVLTIWAQSKAIVPVVVHPLTARIDIAVKGLVFYLYKTLIPVGLAPIHPRPTPSEVFDILFFVSLLLLIAVSAACLYRAKRSRAWLALWLYYIVSLVPVIGLVQVGNQAAADRYMYLPALALFIPAGVFAMFAVQRYGRKGQVAVASTALIVTVVLSALTIRQTGFWSDSVTLWTRQINVYGQRAPIAYFNRGNAYDELERHEEAIRDFTTAIRLGYDPSDSYINRGISLGKAGRLYPAIEDFARTIELAPEWGRPYLNRGTAFLMLGMNEKAAADFAKTIELEPDNAIAYYNLGITYARMRNRVLEIANMRAARRLGLKEAGEYLGNEGLD